MRLFLQFNTSIHQALQRGGLIWSALSFLGGFEKGTWIRQNMNISANMLLLKRDNMYHRGNDAFLGILASTVINSNAYLKLFRVFSVSAIHRLLIVTTTITQLNSSNTTKLNIPFLTSFILTTLTLLDNLNCRLNESCYSQIKGMHHQFLMSHCQCPDLTV